MNTFKIDINADVGEGINNETELLPLVSSCNIACGGHAGNDILMREVALISKKHGVKIGAHPSFPDRDNFGRKAMSIPYSALFKSIKSQVRSLMNILRQEHLQLHHVKPHGALYNLAAKDKAIAEVIIEVMKGIQLPLKLYVPYGSVIAELCHNERIPMTYEAFADRNYNNDLSLVSRDKKNAMITDPEEMFNHVRRMIVHKRVRSINGDEIPIEADTICIHGDSPNAIIIAKQLREKLMFSGISIR